MAEQRWLAHYDSGVPHTLHPYPERTLLDYLADAARDRPGQTALLFKGASVTYGELERSSDAFAAALASLGVRRGDRVAIMMPNCPQFLVAQFGVWKIGGVVVPLNPLYNEQEIQEALTTTGAETLVVLTMFYERAMHGLARTSVRNVIATSIKEYLPGVLRVLFTLLKEKKEGHRITLRPGHRWMRDLLREHEGAAAPGPRPGPGDPATILMSGGTTGTPKGVVGLHQGYVMTGLQVTAWFARALGGKDDIIMLPLPLSHSFGNIGAQSLWLVNGSALALVPNPRDLKDLLRTIDRVRPSFFCGIPTLYNAMVAHPLTQAGKVNLSSIKACFSGAAPLMAETKRRFEEATGGRILEGYSLTEAQLAVTANPLEGENKIGSVGMPLPDVEVRIVDADTGQGPLPPNEIGEILLRGPQMMPAYWDNEAETAHTIRDAGDGSKWLFTGDLGYLDEDGYLFIVDRKKDLIKTSGFQVWPREIEEALSSHPAVAEVGVAGVPHEAKGEVVKAWVVLRAGAAATEDELRAHCRERIAPYKVPAQVAFVPELPKTMVGKVLRRALREQHRAETRATVSA